MDYLISAFQNFGVFVWIFTPFLAVIAWIVFLVNRIRLKSAASSTLRKRRRCVRTVSLILAILFTLAFILLFLCLMEAPPKPISQSFDLNKGNVPHLF
ncbi:MAG: hypothetical protein IJU06_04840 [Oscillospiraceae bacterium]|nr:hypothetical protein [Oscillospiraceae bacterium]